MDTNSPRGRRGVPKQLWFWVLIAIAAGTTFGLVAPDQAKDAKWLADAFVQLVKTITAPVIFLTVVVGIASLGSLTRAGGLAARALGYFLAATVVALALGLLAGNLFKPGAGFEGSPSEDAAGQAKESIAEAGEAGSGIVGFITEDLLPTSFVQPFADNEILKVLVLAILVAAAISGLAPAVRERVVGGFETASKIVFGVIRIIMWAAPLGAFGGMAFTVAQFGGGALKNLGMLLLTFWGTAAVFVLCVLGLVARLNGAGLVTLTASLQAFGGTFFSPESIAVGIALVVGIDRMMSEGRALTNAIGNGVATMVVARWHGELDEERFQKVLDKPSLADPDLEDETAADAEPAAEPGARRAAEPVTA